MADKGSAFVKGGLGCMGLFLVLGLLAVLFGGSMHINLGGAVLLFVIGGLIGLVVFWIYRKGQRSVGGGGDRFGPPDQP